QRRAERRHAVEVDRVLADQSLELGLVGERAAGRQDEREGDGYTKRLHVDFLLRPQPVTGSQETRSIRLNDVQREGRRGPGPSWSDRPSRPRDALLRAFPATITQTPWARTCSTRSGTCTRSASSNRARPSSSSRFTWCTR